MKWMPSLLKALVPDGDEKEQCYNLCFLQLINKVLRTHTAWKHLKTRPEQCEHISCCCKEAGSPSVPSAAGRGGG